MGNDISEFPATVTIPVRWGDMDAFGHVNNTQYFRYFESARIAYFEQMGIYGETLGGVGPILARTSCRFRVPVTYPDTLTAGARVPDVGEDRFTMEYAVWSESSGTMVATGDGVIVSFDYANGRKAPLPDSWKEMIAKLG